MFETFQASLLTLDTDVDDAVLIDRIKGFEACASAIAAAMARDVVRFVASQRAKQIARGVPAERVGLGIASQVGLARKMSPFAASRYITKVETLVSDLPETFAKLTSGEVSEQRALIVAKEVSWLSPEHRQQVDAEVAPQVTKLGTRRLVDAVKKIAYRLDPTGFMKRLKIAESERCVTSRPAADGMMRLTLLLPMVIGVSAYAALRAAAMARRGVGDETRSLDQLMADIAVERLTGREHADDVPVEVCVIMTDQTLFNSGPGKDEPATVINGGVIPAHMAREVMDKSSKVWLRRLYADPAGKLAAMESNRRLFTAAQRKQLILRDQLCRTPFCDAPIRHGDHVDPHENGGPTSIANGQGLCEACNHAKQAAGWIQYKRGDQIITVTPTGHVYTSDEPALLERKATQCAAA